ncbi:ABC transporter permease [Opitutales bacterium ASA1]|uniref:ABC transporter permease n=1 Tax=Congregicoccus parvus TaxID=3081749 RepID=UPI002B3097F9|nr:ABC transporter permease [Opitutales bacterium ASA1]
MSPTVRIAVRFLFARKRSMLMSLTGIVFGVGFFIVSQAQTSGFEEFFIKTVLGTDGALRVEDKYQDTLRAIDAAGGGSGSRFQISARGDRRFVEGVEDPRLVREALAQFGNVAAISEVVRGSVLAQSALREDPAQILGIGLDDHLQVSDLANQIILGNLEEYRGNMVGALVGVDLAARLQVSVGDSVTLSTSRGESRRFRVDAVFRTGIRDIDKVRIYVHTSEARSLLGRPFGASYLQINLHDRDRAPADAMRMEPVLQHVVTAWQEREKVWLDVFGFLQVSFAITVSSIILISGLGMFNTLAMIVMEKTREIAILRSMGYTRRDISRIFLWQGAIVLAIGTVLGCMVGAAITWGVSSLPIRIRGIFSTDHFVVHWSIWHYVWAALTAGVIVMIASLIPARRAARLEPGDVIRGTAT